MHFTLNLLSRNEPGGGRRCRDHERETAAMNTSAHAPMQGSRKIEIAFSIDRFCNFSRLGNGWSLLTGWPLDAMAFKPIVDFVHPADRPAVLEALQSLLRREMY